jgi:hypothetical protein
MKMKIYKLFAIIGVILALASCEKQDLPYDLDGVERGVIINIAKVAGTSTSLSTDMNEGNYQVELSVPEYYQGDMSMFKEAQLMAVYTDGNKNVKAAHVVEGITSFPATIKIDIKDVCSKLGVSELSVGDRIEFTPCYTLKSGTQVDGWNQYSRFNNTRFTWQLEDGSNYSYRVAYTAFAPFIKEHYQGIVPQTYGVAKVTQISELPDAQWIPKGVTANDLVGLLLEGDIFFGGDTIKVWINTQDYTLIIPDQVICPDFTYGSYGTYDGELLDGEGEVDTLHETLTFYMYSGWGPYSFGDDTITFYFGDED